MSILDRIKSFEYDKNRKKIFGIKSAIVWGNLNDKNVTVPLFYISKPKHLSNEDFEVILESIEISLTKK